MSGHTLPGESMEIPAMPTALPALDSDYLLAPELVEHYQEKGWVLLREVASPEEIAAYRPILTATTMANNRHTKPIDERDTYGKAFIQVGNLWEKSEDAARFTVSRRFARIAAELMQAPGARLYHDQALYKEPGGGPTPWHQDQQYWPLDGVRCITMWMPLVDADAGMGTMRFASGSQSLGYLGPMNISDDSEAALDALIRENGFQVEAVGDMRAGDATFHNGWTIHGAPGNLSPDRTREVMTIIYFEDGAIISEPDSPQRLADLKGCFPDRVPGERADGRLNPLLYCE
jgi:ectoine hydroxylase-related dioxygenase (phytanoyl-CoA dioxygenase family)